MCWASPGCIQGTTPFSPNRLKIYSCLRSSSRSTNTAFRCKPRAGFKGPLLPASSLDEVLLRLGRINLQNADLSPFENDILHDVRQTLFPQARPGGPVLAG